jgi:uncharacterized protein
MQIEIPVSKFLFFVLVAIAVYFLLRARRRDSAPGPDSSGPASPEAMVECAYCRLHVPLSESLEAAGRRYCCDDHRRLDLGGRG